MIRMSTNPSSGSATPRLAQPLTDCIAAIQHVLGDVCEDLYAHAIVREDGRHFVDATSAAWAMHEGVQAWSYGFDDAVRRCWKQYEMQVYLNCEKRPLSDFVADALWEACWIWIGANRLLGRHVDSTAFWKEVRVEWNWRFTEVLYMECIHVDVNDGTPLDGLWDPCLHFYWNWGTELREPKSHTKPARQSGRLS